MWAGVHVHGRGYCAARQLAVKEFFLRNSRQTRTGVKASVEHAHYSPATSKTPRNAAGIGGSIAEPISKTRKAILFERGPARLLVIEALLTVLGHPGRRFLPPVALFGTYWHHIITEPLRWWPLIAIFRLAKPSSMWADWFYNEPKMQLAKAAVCNCEPGTEKSSEASYPRSKSDGTRRLQCFWVQKAADNNNTMPQVNAADFNELPDSEKQHFYKCKRCGEFVDMRQLDDVLFHEDHIHRPDIRYGGSQCLEESEQ
jgi:hypothetical protein